jgi:hypothetical protein
MSMVGHAIGLLHSAPENNKAVPPYTLMQYPLFTATRQKKLKIK